MDVLAPRVGDDGRRRAHAASRPTGLDQDGDGVGGVEALRDAPREDAAGEVVDDGVDVDLHAVEQPEERRVDVPDLVRPRRSDAHAGLFGMDTGPRTAPPALADEAKPRRGGREHGARSLREEGEASGGDVAQVVGGDHLAHPRDLGRGQAVRRRPGARRLVGELAGAGGASPRGESGRREPDGGEDAPQPEHASGTLDGPQQPRLVEGGDAEAREVGLDGPQEREHDVQNGDQPTAAPLEAGEAAAQDRRLVAGARGGDDSGRPSQPSRDRGPGHPEPRGDRRVARLLDEEDETMVVGALRTLRGHRASIPPETGAGSR